MEKKNKKELVKEAQKLADKLFEKKAVIKTALDCLDSKEKVGSEHIEGMAIIEEMFTEYDAIEFEQFKIFELIKKT